MTGQEKAALLLLQLPAEQAESVLARLGPERAQRLRDEVQRLQQAPPPEQDVEELFRQLDQVLLNLPEPPAASEAPPKPPQEAEMPPAPEVPPPAPAIEGEQKAPAAPAPADALPDEAAIAADPLAALRQMAGSGAKAMAASVDRLALALSDEHPRTIALVLNQMEPDRAGEVLRRLLPEMRREVTIQLGKPMNVNPELVNRVVRTVLEKCRTLAEAPAAGGGANRFKRMAEMLRRLDKADRMEVLAALEQSDAASAASVREFLYSFDDLLLIEDRSMQKLLAEIDSKSLASALKGASDAIKEKVRNNLSKRARETLNEEMELLGALPAPTIQQAQKAVVDVIQRLDQAGELTMLQ